MQRYLTAKSIDEARHSLLMSAFVKIPLQLLISCTGVLVFVFYIFQTPPMLFNRVHDAQVVAESDAVGEYAALQQRFDDEAVAVRREPAGPSDTAGVSGVGRAAEGHPRAQAARRRQGEPPATAVFRRELRVSDLHHDAACRSGWSG